MVKQTCHGWLYGYPGNSYFTACKYIDILQVAFHTLPPFSPYIPTLALPYLAVGLLSSTFGLAFYFTTYVLSFRPCFTRSLIQLQLAKSVSGRKRTCRFFRRKSPWRLRNRRSVLQCWRLRLINILYINYLHAIRVCKLHTSCRSASIIPTIPKTYRVEDRWSFIRASQLKTLRS